MPLHHLLLTNLATITIAVIGLWLVSVAVRNASIIDIFWGCGLVLVAWTSLACSGRFDMRPLVVTSLVTLWGLRLAGYLAWRNIGKPEDYRYVAMREKHGKRFSIVSLFTVFGLQGLLMWIISLPVQVGISQADSWQPWRYVGVILWLMGLFFEAVGDYQLARFKSLEGRRFAVDTGFMVFNRRTYPNFCRLWRYWGFDPQQAT